MECRTNESDGCLFNLGLVVGSVGVMARQILFNLAGERFVARLRKQVVLMLFYM